MKAAPGVQLRRSVLAKTGWDYQGWRPLDSPVLDIARAAFSRRVVWRPQRRSDDGRVAWTWREAVEKKPLTVARTSRRTQTAGAAKESFGRESDESADG